jgi:WD40 repeat protein
VILFTVFCVDYNTELDLVVSGSSDGTIKLWQMSTGSCLATKLGHQNWLISVSPVDPMSLQEETQTKLNFYWITQGSGHIL